MKKIALLLLAIFFISCSEEKKDLIHLEVLEKTLKPEQKYQIESTSISPIKYTIENKHLAIITSDGLVKAKYVGETNILLENSNDIKTFKIIIEPKSNLYTEPDVEFGDDKSDIIAKFGSDYTETTTAIGYTNYANTEHLILFSFDQNNKLEGYIVMVKSKDSSDLVRFLTERYLLASIEKDLFMFLNGADINNASKLISLQLYNSSYYLASYQANTPGAIPYQVKNIPNKYEGLIRKTIQE